MPGDILTIEVDPESDIAELLGRAETEPVVLALKGIRFRLEREIDDSYPDSGGEPFWESLRRFAGILEPEEGERWKEEVYRAREEGSRPSSRPRPF